MAHILNLLLLAPLALSAEGEKAGVKISEAGRQFLLKRLRAMVESPEQIHNLVIGAHMDMDRHSTIDGWVNAFIAKVGEIERTGPCE